MSTKLRVLVVDDSALMRKLIPQILARDNEIEVVGTAMDGAFGLKKIEDLRPDVVTLDLEMPRMDGLETLRQITRRFRV
ncbi:MAG: response regulator, partial [Candidatus Angelobacter sp.]